MKYRISHASSEREAYDINAYECAKVYRPTSPRGHNNLENCYTSKEVRSPEPLRAAQPFVKSMNNVRGVQKYSNCSGYTEASAEVPYPLEYIT